MARSKTSLGWLKRHVNDPYVKQAQKDGYRSRASYKLLEVQEKYKLIRPGMSVVDLGAAPGGWSQVTSRLIGGQGRLIASDIPRSTTLIPGRISLYFSWTSRSL